MIDDDVFNQIMDGQPAETPLMKLVDWASAFNRPPVDAVVDGYVFPGRWTALVAPAKTGKSTLAMHIGIKLSQGIDPFHGSTQEPIDVLYLDGEMGELDVVERLQALDLTPADLARFHYTDILPKGDTLQGGAAIVSTALGLGAGLVIMDGLNAFVTGAEKDDTPWRNLFDHTIAPLKRASLPVLSSDNTGKDTTLSARGSSVKLDKADAIIELKRTDNGLTLTTTHQRSSQYTRRLDLNIDGLDESQPINYRPAHGAWPAGTARLAAELDRLGVPTKAGRDQARQALKAAGATAPNVVLSAAIRYRKDQLLSVKSDHSPLQKLSADRSGQDDHGQGTDRLSENDF